MKFSQYRIGKAFSFIMAMQMIAPAASMAVTPGLIVGSGGPIYGSAGEYQHNTFNQGQILEKVLQQYHSIGQQDYEQVTQFVASINTRINDLIANHLKASEPFTAGKVGTPDGLFALAISPAPIPLQNYLTARQDFIATKMEIQLAIDSIKGIRDSMQGTPSEVKADLGIKGMAMTMPQPLKDIVVATAVGPAEETLAKMAGYVEGLGFRVTMYDGSVQPITGTNFDIKNIKIPLAERERIQKEITANSGYTLDERRQLSQYAIALRQKINEVMKTAASEGYRLSDPKFKTDVMDSLDEIFFTRSLLRMRFGVPVGGAAIKHQPASFYKEWFTTGANIDWEAETLFTFNDKESRLRDMRAGFETASARAVSWEGWKAGDSVVWQAVSGISSIVSFVKGTKDQERFKAAVLGLIISDFEEESTVTQAGGLRLLKDRFVARYTANADTKAKYAPLFARVSGTIDHFLGRDTESDDGFGGASDMVTEDAQGIVGAIVGTLNNYQARAEVVRKNRQYLASLGADESTTKDEKKRSDTTKKLFD